MTLPWRNGFPGNRPGFPAWIPCLFKRQETRLLSEQENPFLPPSLPVKIGGDPEAFILGISSLPRVETTSIVSSQSRVGRGPSSRRKGRLCRLAGGWWVGVRKRGRYCEVREEREGVSPKLFEAGQRDPAGTGSLKEEIGIWQPRCGSGSRECSTFPSQSILA